MKYFLFFIVALINSKPAMTQINYKVIATSECIKYIEAQLGREFEITDFYKTIPSQSGLLIKLKNNKIVLVPSNFDPNYPGFIFDDEKSLERMVDDDFYPIGRDNMTAWEIIRNELNILPKSVTYFHDFAFGKSECKPFIKSMEDFRCLYDSVIKNLKISKDPILSHQLVISFAIIVMNFMVENDKAKWQFDKRFEQYNSYKYPSVKVNDREIDLIQLVMICVEDIPKDFDFFLNSVNR